MNDIDALLKRSFAEAPEPADDGFAVQVTHAVARRETVAKWRQGAQNAGMAAAGVGVLYGVYGLVGAFGQQFLASAGLEIALAHSALSSAPDAAGAQAQNLVQAVGAGLTQVLFIAAALAGGAVAYRATQD